MPREGTIFQKILDDGREVCVYPLIMGTVRVVIGDPDENTYDDAWCYESATAGTYAAAAWDGEGDPPDGWFRHIGTGRRRPGGDPSQEYVMR